MSNIKHRNPSAIIRPKSTYPTLSSVEFKKIQNYIYKFSDEIGQGNFSKVYKGINEKTNETIAIKTIELHSLDSQRLKQLLNTETMILKTLDHPNIIHCTEILSSVRNCYIITELCDGGDLGTRFKQQKEKYGKEKYIYTIAVDVYEGLRYLSRKNIIHRDLKISNVFIHQGVYKIADFGFAQVSSSEFKDISVGSPVYMSPEGYLQNVYGPKTDVWAFGVMLYELVEGHPPCYNSSTEAELKENLKQKISKQSFKSNEISDGLKQLIMNCLQIDPQRRIRIQDISSLEWMKKAQKIVKAQRNPINNKQNIDLNSIAQNSLQTRLSTNKQRLLKNHSFNFPQTSHNKSSNHKFVFNNTLTTPMHENQHRNMTADKKWHDFMKYKKQAVDESRNNPSYQGEQSNKMCTDSLKPSESQQGLIGDRKKGVGLEINVPFYNKVSNRFTNQLASKNPLKQVGNYLQVKQTEQKLNTSSKFPKTLNSNLLVNQSSSDLRMRIKSNYSKTPTVNSSMNKVDFLKLRTAIKTEQDYMDKNIEKDQQYFHAELKKNINKIEEGIKCRKSGGNTIMKNQSIQLNRKSDKIHSTADNVLEPYRKFFYLARSKKDNVQDLCQYGKDRILATETSSKKTDQAIENILNRKELKFEDCIGLIHYCRLCYKFACLQNEKTSSNHIEIQQLYINWCVLILQELMTQIVKGVIFIQARPTPDAIGFSNAELKAQNDKKNKLRDVAEQYLKKYKKLARKVQNSKGMTIKQVSASTRGIYLSKNQDFNKACQNADKSPLSHELIAQNCYILMLDRETRALLDFSEEIKTSFDGRVMQKLLSHKLTDFTLKTMEDLIKSSC